MTGQHDIQEVVNDKSVTNPSCTHAEKTPPRDMADPAVVSLTPEDDARIRKKTDRTILVLLTWVYFLQVLDKAVLGTGAVFNLQKDLNLKGNQYSLIGSIASIAQLAWQPFSAWLIVRVPHRYLMPSLVLGWGIAESCMSACNTFGSLLACRFFLGLFEAGCLPLFAITTGKWYRRAEQPIRVAIWNSTNGLSTIVSSALSYGLGHIESDVLYKWQIIFLFCGLLTIATSPVVYWRLDNDISEARFLTPEDRIKGIQRLQTNQSSVGERHDEFKWAQVREAALDAKTYLWLILAILPNMGSVLPSTFGPLILNGFGFDKYQTLLVNMPFGAVQTIVILLGCFAANKMKLKGVVLCAFAIPVVAGTGMLYGCGRSVSDRPALLAAYYMVGFLFAANPLIVAWAVGNTGGATKKSVTISLFQAGLSAGGLIGPLLFNANDAPEYRPGIAGTLGVFIAMIVCVLLQLGILWQLNRSQAKRRVTNGKSAEIIDKSMRTTLPSGGKHHEDDDGILMDEQSAAARLDLTDRQNDEFVYIY